MSENPVIEKKSLKPQVDSSPANKFSFSTDVGNLDLYNQTRQTARQAYLSTVGDHLVIDVPTRTKQGGEFDKMTRVEYHSVTIDEWDTLETERAVLFDMTRQLQLTMDDYKHYKLPVPKNYTTLYSDYRKKQQDVNDKMCVLLLGKNRKDFNLCDQRLLQDVLDAYALRNTTGNVNLPTGDDKDTSTGIS